MLTDVGEGGGRKAEGGVTHTIRNPQSEIRNSPDPVFLEIFNNHLASIAEQMGITLRNTASSVNVKERLDFSCAIFTADGWLVANAPHVPVHLGAMEETVRHTIAANPDLQPGDVIATNDPYAGGSHLPDVTVITPVFGPCSVAGVVTPDFPGFAGLREASYKLRKKPNGAAFLYRESGPSRGDRRHCAGFDAAVVEESGGGRRSYPEFENCIGRRVAIRSTSRVVVGGSVSDARCGSEFGGRRGAGCGEPAGGE